MDDPQIVSDFQLCLEGGDIDGLCRLWAQVFPHLHQPESREQMEYMYHAARVMAESTPFAKRAWSHQWLKERGFPSNLPDHLKPSAERLYPREFAIVGVAVGTTRSGNATLREFGGAVEKAMGEKAWEMMDDGVANPARIKGEMMAARQRIHRQW